jgi:hypothetical protein
VPHIVPHIELNGHWLDFDRCFDEPLYRGGRAMGLNAFANLKDIDWNRERGRSHQVDANWVKVTCW